MRIEPLTRMCTNGVEAMYGGTEVVPHYSGCIHINGDYLRVMDNRADGKAAVMKWAFYPKSGSGFSSTASRKGICIYAGGSASGKKSGTCNKNLPESGVIKMWAGPRQVPGSHNPSDVTYGDPACLGLAGTTAYPDPYCLLPSM